MQNPPKKNERKINESQQAVIMIDPFPEPPTYDVKGSLDVGLDKILKGLLSALQNQVRFKPGDLVAALDDEVGSRFLVAPRRRKKHKAPVEDFPIACGLLGGFGGFLDEEFRAHDYQLGQFNCYHFLKNSLVLPEKNAILKEGYSPTGQWDKFEPTQTRSTRHYQLIPLMGSAANEPTAPVWPRVTKDILDTMVEHADKRLHAVVKKAVSEPSVSGFWRTTINGLWVLWGRREAKKKIRWHVLRDLIIRDQITETTAYLPADARKVFAGLTDPAYDLRTVAGIARDYELEPNVVDKVISEYGDKIYELPRVQDRAQNRDASYTLITRQPRKIRQGRIMRFIKDLKID